ncbi:MAG: hypothetical protein JNN11_05025 [Candidatus Doudnabacteria bacterium]|nr:hypothetical protein [Candidatus Doudnabacteria bacterium]
MNIHPALVHFPIAFFSLYAFLEVLRFRAFTNLPFWFYTKAVVLFAGVLSAPVVLLSGKVSEDLLASDPYIGSIVEKHEFFAFLSCGIFGILFLAYVIVWYAKYKKEKGIILESNLVGFVEKFLDKYAWIFAILGFVCILITASLGGLMVYGPNNDPVLQMVYSIFVK